MNTEFDWFMITMPLFAIVVYLIVMVGSLEKQPAILESEGTQKILGIVFVALFGGGMLFACFKMLALFVELLANY